MRLNIWPWSKIRELEEMNIDLLEGGRRLVRMKNEALQECLRLKNAYALKCVECDNLLKTMALSAKERKRRRVKIRRAALLWHEWTEEANK